MTRTLLPEAGGSIETAEKRGKPIERRCAKCDCPIDKRKTWCGPCYDIRLQENIVASRARRRSARPIKEDKAS